MYDNTMKSWPKTPYFKAILLSVLAHLLLGLGSFTKQKQVPVANNKRVFNIRHIGIEKGSDQGDLIAIGEKAPLEIEDLVINPRTDSTQDKISVKKSAIKKTAQPTALRKKIGDPDFSNSDVTVNIDLPKGVKLNELNPEELKFFSFQKRTLLQYVGTFNQEVRNFEVSNPHLRLPLTNKKQILRGRISFDEQGNIKRIKVLEWSEKPKLQSFFLDVLKKIEKVPNPPRLILQDNDEFSIIYSLIINA